MKTNKWYRQQWLATCNKRDHLVELLYWHHPAYPPVDQLKQELAHVIKEANDWYILKTNSEAAE
jgi:hypothetical protein